MNLEITIQGDKDILSNLDGAMKEFEAKVNEAIQGAGIDTEADAKKNTPVDTGRLRNSIKYTPAHLSCTVGTNVNYAIYVHEGARGRAGRPFLYNAWWAAAKELEKELRGL